MKFSTKQIRLSCTLSLFLVFNGNAFANVGLVIIHFKVQIMGILFAHVSTDQHPCIPLDSSYVFWSNFDLCAALKQSCG